MNNKKYLKAVFIEEYSKRFLGRILIDRREELVYIPSSSKLSHLLCIDGADVLVQKNKTVGRTKYTLVAAKINNKYIYLNLKNVNYLLYARICNEANIPIECIKCEKRLYWGYRADVYVDGTVPEIFEAKSIVSENNIVCFPQVFSERACRQLENISKAINDNMKACYCFMVLSSNIEHIVIKEDTKFKKNFDDCVKRGMEVRVYRIEYKGTFNCRRDYNLEIELNNRK